MRETRDKEEIREILRKDRALHIYELGDLDEFFWPFTKWYRGEGDALALVYGGTETPCLLAFERTETDTLSQLLLDVTEILVGDFNAHVSPHLVKSLLGSHHVVWSSQNEKMGLDKQSFVPVGQQEGCETLHKSQIEEIEHFYEKAYPDNWFDSRMLETGFYVGQRNAGALVSVAGVHVVSQDFGVAALGNIATSPSHGGQGYAKRGASALCEQLLSRVECIGLNVKSDNQPALRCYQALGFRKVADYTELGLRLG